MANPYQRWGLLHNPFVKQPPKDAATRQRVFTGRIFERDRIVESAKCAEPCCVYGTYGIGKTMLMLETERDLLANNGGLLPVYVRVLPGKGFKDFDEIVLEGMTQVIQRHGISYQMDPHKPALVQIRTCCLVAKENNTRLFAMIDDMDRSHDIESISSVIHTVRELRDLDCGVCLPGNPNNATHQFGTAAQGIIDQIDLGPLSTGQYIEMIKLYLETARGAKGTKRAESSGIFLSYARQDEHEVRKLSDQLTSRGLRTWMDTKNLFGGEKWRTAIRQALRKAAFCILCLSRNSSNKRGYLRQEIRIALDVVNEMLERDIFLIPVRLEQCDIPDEVADLHCIDLYSLRGVASLEEAVREGMRRRDDDINLAHDEPEMLSTEPFEPDAISRILERTGVETMTPRMLNTSCRTLLDLAARQDCDKITSVFVDTNWERIGAQILSSEGNIEKCARLVRELMKHDGILDEDNLDLSTLLEIVSERHAGYSDLIQQFAPFDDVFHIEDRGGNMTVTLNPLIDHEFVKKVFLKKDTEDFRQEYQVEGDDDKREDPSVVSSLLIRPPGPIYTDVLLTTEREQGDEL